MFNLSYAPSCRNLRSLRLERLPKKLHPYQQWVLWRYEDYGGKKPAKVPYDPRTGRRASATDPRTWGTLTEALLAYRSEDYSGIGFVFTEGDSFVGVDLDKCRDPETGKIQPWALEIIQRVPSYWEASPSGTGLHGIAEMAAPLPQGRRKDTIEIYEDSRYFTLTGNHIEGTATDITDCTQEVLALHGEVFGTTSQSNANMHLSPVLTLSDEKLLHVASTAKNGDKFQALWRGDTTGYPSPSEADLALCSLLAFYCGQEPARIARLFRQSGLYRDKWDRTDYAQRTIEQALESVRNFYTASAKPQLNATLGVMAAFVAAYPWHGTAANNARLVMCALLQRMTELGRTEVAAACRDVAEMTGLAFATAALALRRLCGVGKDTRDDIPILLTRTVDTHVELSEPRATRHAYRYALNKGAEFTHAPTQGGTVLVECVSFAPLLETVAHDSFRVRGKGLPRSAALVLHALPCRTASEIVESTHFSLRTVRSALAILKKEGLVVKDSGVWSRTCETLKLDAVAERRGTAGASERQVKLHMWQRKVYSTYLMRSAARKTTHSLSDGERQPPDPVWGDEIEWQDVAWRDAA